MLFRIEGWCLIVLDSDDFNRVWGLHLGSAKASEIPFMTLQVFSTGFGFAFTFAFKSKVQLCTWIKATLACFRSEFEMMRWWDEIHLIKILGYTGNPADKYTARHAQQRQLLDKLVRRQQMAEMTTNTTKCTPKTHTLGDTFAALPIELQLKTFDCLNLREKIQAEAVCKTWQSLMRSLHRNVDLKLGKANDEAVMKWLGKVANQNVDYTENLTLLPYQSASKSFSYFSTAMATCEDLASLSWLVKNCISRICISPI